MEDERTPDSPDVRVVRSARDGNRGPSSSPAPSSEAARRRMQATRRRDTAAEERLRAELTALGLEYVVDAPPIAGLRRRADVLFPTHRIAVYVDGCFWHGCPTHGTWPKANAQFWRDKIEANRRRDADTNGRLEKEGWRVLRFWEHDDPVEAARSVARAVSASTTR